MKMTKTVKLQKQTIDGTISMTIPKPLAELFQLKVGEKVDVVFDVENPDHLKIYKQS